MSERKTDNISAIAFSSTVFPTSEDAAVWDSLSDVQKRAVIARDEEQGFQSGIAPKESLEERLARVRADRGV